MSAELFPTKPPAADPRDTTCVDCGDPHAGCIDAGQRKCVRCVHPSFWPKNREALS
ncbi:hypothetical protein [Synechococcus phage Ssp-JY42]|nr:hypothetical protein [Synechococcus phage Yong-M4-211]